MITAWKAAHPPASGHQGSCEMREIANALLCQGRTGCQREYLPHDLPPRSAAYCYFAKWRDDGTDQVIHDLLRWHAREKKGRKADPGLVHRGQLRVRFWRGWRTGRAAGWAWEPCGQRSYDKATYDERQRVVGRRLDG